MVKSGVGIICKGYDSTVTCMAETDGTTGDGCGTGCVMEIICNAGSDEGSVVGIDCIRKAFVLLGCLLSSLLCCSAAYASGPADSTSVNEDDPFFLEELVLTATRTPKKLKDSPVITQVISSRQIEERGLKSIQDLLMQEVPGLNFQEVGFGTSIDIQGLGAQHVLFLVDGERMAGENGGNIDYTRLNLSNIERIEIVKGASSALYGSQAMGGVVNIITKEATRKVEVSGGVKYTTPNQTNYRDNGPDSPQYIFRRNVDRQNLNADLSLGFRLGKVTLNTDAVYKSYDGYRLYDRKGVEKYFPEYGITVAEDPSTVPTSISGYEDLQVGQKVKYRINDRLTLSARAGFYMLNKYDFNPDNLYEQTFDYTFGMSGEYKVDSFAVLTASVHADDYCRYDKFELLPGRRLEYNNRMYQPRVIYTDTRFIDQTITAGAEYYYETLYTDKFVSGVKESKTQWYGTLFLQDDWSILKNLSLIGGIRGDYHMKYGFNATPKISLMYRISPVTLRFNYAMGYRSPSIKELYMNWDHLGMFWIYGNDRLKPETNNYISLSAEYSDSWFNVSVNGYCNWFRNKIEGVWAANQTELHYTNLGRSFLAGAELMGKARIGRYFNLHANYSYLYVQKDKSGVQLNSSSPHSGTIRVEFNSKVRKYATVVNLSGTVTGRKEFDVLGTLEVDGKEVESYYKAVVDPYSIWNLTVTQNILDYIRITIGVNNIFNYTADRVSFNSSTSPGRTFFVSLNIAY